MTEDPATWSPMQRRAWAINLVLKHVSWGSLDKVGQYASQLEQCLAGADVIAPSAGLPIRQEPFGSAS